MNLVPYLQKYSVLRGKGYSKGKFRRAIIEKYENIKDKRIGIFGIEDTVWTL